MIRLKKATLVALALSTAPLLAHAGMYAPPVTTTNELGCGKGSVNVSCDKLGWSFSADALAVQTNNVGQTTSTITANDTSHVANYENYPADWQWGFQLAAGYYFGTGNDVNLNWTHFVHSSSQTVTSAADSGSELSGQYLYNGGTLLNDAPIDTIETEVGNNFNSVNFEFGQTVHFGEHVDSRLHAGVQYAAITETINQNGWNGADASIYNEANVESSFYGVGPRLGIDSAYNFSSGISLFGNLAASILVGNVNLNQWENQTAPEGESGKTSSISASSNHSIMPEAEAKLGIRYTQPFSEGNLIADVGYEIVNYWNAVMSNDADGQVTTDNDFEYNGFVFGLKWLGDA